MIEAEHWQSATAQQWFTLSARAAALRSDVNALQDRRGDLMMDRAELVQNVDQLEEHTSYAAPTHGREAEWNRLVANLEDQRAQITRLDGQIAIIDKSLVAARDRLTRFGRLLNACGDVLRRTRLMSQREIGF